jgi:hypothetical protein
VLCVSFVTLAEITVWAEVRHWGPTNQAALRDWLGGLVRLPYDDEVARTWGRAAGRGDPPWANAAGQRHLDRGLLHCPRSATGATHNLKDFTDFVDYHGLRLLTE